MGNRSEMISRWNCARQVYNKAQERQEITPVTIEMIDDFIGLLANKRAEASGKDQRAELKLLISKPKLIYNLMFGWEDHQ